MRCFLLLVAVIVVGCEANTEPSQSQGNSVSKWQTLLGNLKARLNKPIW